MLGLVPSIHDFLLGYEDVDGRDKPGHDGDALLMRRQPV
jgi:hypothetical protein